MIHDDARQGPRLRRPHRSGSSPGSAPYFGSHRLHARAQLRASSSARWRSWGAPGENQVYADTPATSAGSPAAWRRCGPTGTACCPCPATAATSGPASGPATSCPRPLNPQAGWFAIGERAEPARRLPLPRAQARLRVAAGVAPAARRRDAAVGCTEGEHRGFDAAAERPALAPGAPPAGGAARINRATPTRAAAARLLLDWNAVRTRRLGGGGAVRGLVVAPPRPGGEGRVAAVAPRRADPDHRCRAAARDHGTPGHRRSAAMRSPGATRSSRRAWPRPGPSMQRLAGPDADAWRWDKLHQVLLAHPLSNATDAATRARLNVGPFAQAGRQRHRQRLELRPGDVSQARRARRFASSSTSATGTTRAPINAPGQSGDPASPHYRDLAPLWLRGEYFPLLYTRPGRGGRAAPASSSCRRSSRRLGRRRRRRGRAPVDRACGGTCR